ncbi:hypothetical protein DVH24_034839 [Malus domestica]|uniref:Uncharacterized protein n=1 Tax=Malus domestica TaxID=3750 RepID=A0A498ICJ4_MALDO|nr:hypothetical protein DVH24_034839 [Malus domestica]
MQSTLQWAINNTFKISKERRVMPVIKKVFRMPIDSWLRHAPIAASKLAILSIFLALIFSQIRAVASILAEEEEPVKFPRSDTPDSSALKIELNQLRAKILGSFLSSSANSRVYWTKFVIFQVFVEFDFFSLGFLAIQTDFTKVRDPLVFQLGKFDASEKIKALKKKNELIEEEEEVIQGNSDSISSLQSEIESLQPKQKREKSLSS